MSIVLLYFSVLCIVSLEASWRKIIVFFCIQILFLYTDDFILSNLLFKVLVLVNYINSASH